MNELYERINNFRLCKSLQRKRMSLDHGVVLISQETCNRHNALNRDTLLKSNQGQLSRIYFRISEYLLNACWKPQLFVISR